MLVGNTKTYTANLDRVESKAHLLINHFSLAHGFPPLKLRPDVASFLSSIIISIMTSFHNMLTACLLFLFFAGLLHLLFY